MKTYHLSVYVGPTLVTSMAREFREAGFMVELEGTERVYLAMDSDSGNCPESDFLRRLRTVCGTRFGLGFRDVMVIRATEEAARKTCETCGHVDCRGCVYPLT